MTSERWDRNPGVESQLESISEFSDTCVSRLKRQKDEHLMSQPAALTYILRTFLSYRCMYLFWNDLLDLYVITWVLLNNCGGRRENSMLAKSVFFLSVGIGLCFSLSDAVLLYFTLLYFRSCCHFRRHVNRWESTERSNTDALMQSLSQMKCFTY